MVSDLAMYSWLELVPDLIIFRFIIDGKKNQKSDVMCQCVCVCEPMHLECTLGPDWWRGIYNIPDFSFFWSMHIYGSFLRKVYQKCDMGLQKSKLIFLTVFCGI